jgi:hypothetical protein
MFLERFSPTIRRILPSKRNSQVPVAEKTPDPEQVIRTLNRRMGVVAAKACLVDASGEPKEIGTMPQESGWFNTIGETNERLQLVTYTEVDKDAGGRITKVELRHRVSPRDNNKAFIAPGFIFDITKGEISIGRSDPTCPDPEVISSGYKGQYLTNAEKLVDLVEQSFKPPSTTPQS